MRKRGKYILMDLICWFLAFINWKSVRRPLVESRHIRTEIPLVNKSLAAAVFVPGRRLSRGPTLATRRSDL